MTTMVRVMLDAARRLLPVRPPDAETDRKVLGLALALLLALGSVLAACGSDDDKTSSTTTTTATADSALKGDLTVFAAASLTEAFEDTQKTLQSSAPDLNLKHCSPGSQDLVQQIEDGAPPTCSPPLTRRTCKSPWTTGWSRSPRCSPATSWPSPWSLAIPKKIKGLEDLSRSDVTVVLADPSVPVGNYSKQILDKADVTVKPASLRAGRQGHARQGHLR